MQKGMHMKTATFTVLSLAALLGSAAAQTAQTTPVGTSGTATTAASTTGAAAAATSADYRLAAGDKLRIEVYKDAQLSQSLQVRPDGKITLPLVGDLAAAGRTSLELRDAIAASLTDYMKNPTVTVIVVETTPQVVYVTGEVTKPGPVTIAGPLSILQALAMAGGFTDFANRKEILILRNEPSGQKTLTFNYKDAINQDTRRAPMQLRAGDTVIVK
jgi:polysaccharide export outer membrane protein